MDSLFTDLIAKHPDKERIRAIIDVGSHFRGMSNDEVARMTGRFLQMQKSTMQGILYFDPTNSVPLFVRELAAEKGRESLI